jgi:hypothetical protein
MKKYFQFLDVDGDIEGSVITDSQEQIGVEDEMIIQNEWIEYYNSENYDGIDGFVDLLNEKLPTIKFERFYFDNVFNA